MENQPRCLIDQKTKKIVDAIDAMDDEKGIKEYAYDEGENGKKHVKNRKTYTCQTCGKIFKDLST